MHIAARARDPFGGITVRSKQDGGFTCGGLEFHLPTFVACLREKGYSLANAAREDLSDFGSR
ncbi:MAG: hypothetical protein ACREI6_08610 [Candidatus Rokuibacteriota bacterium]